MLYLQLVQEEPLRVAIFVHTHAMRNDEVYNDFVPDALELELVFPMMRIVGSDLLAQFPVAKSSSPFKQNIVLITKIHG